MATIILRDAGSISSPGSTAKGSPLTNLEVDNNFSNINVTLGVLTNLTTTAQGNLVVAINELVTSNATQNTQITLVTTNLATTNSNIGVLSGLTTTNTSNIVFAVNELVTANTTQGTQITLLTSNIGVLSGLTTSNIGNLVSAVNELNASSGVAAATYGNATIVPVFTVNAKGRITSAANTTISLSPSGVAASTYGSTGIIPVIVVGADGRITSASNATPTFATTGKAIAMAMVFGG